MPRLLEVLSFFKLWLLSFLYIILDSSKTKKSVKGKHRSSYSKCLWTRCSCNCSESHARSKANILKRGHFLAKTLSARKNNLQHRQKKQNLLEKSALHILGAPTMLFMKNQVELCIAETTSLAMFQSPTLQHTQQNQRRKDRFVRLSIVHVNFCRA